MNFLFEHVQPSQGLQSFGYEFDQCIWKLQCIPESTVPGNHAVYLGDGQFLQVTSTTWRDSQFQTHSPELYPATTISRPSATNWRLDRQTHRLRDKQRMGLTFLAGGGLYCSVCQMPYNSTRRWLPNSRHFIYTHTHTTHPQHLTASENWQLRLTSTGTTACLHNSWNTQHRVDINELKLTDVGRECTML